MEETKIKYSPPSNSAANLENMINKSVEKLRLLTKSLEICGYSSLSEVNLLEKLYLYFTAPTFNAPLMKRVYKQDLQMKQDDILHMHQLIPKVFHRIRDMRPNKTESGSATQTAVHFLSHRKINSIL